MGGNSKKDSPDNDSAQKRSRRDFVTLSAAAGLVAAASGGISAAKEQVVDRDVNIQTRDGICDAAFIHPASGSHPAIIIWTDVGGLRPVFRQFGRRLAAVGYTVVVPNPFYRTGPSPVYTPAEIADGNKFQEPSFRAKIARTTGPINAPGAIESDARSLVAFLDSQPQVDASRRIGTQGYCMGGPLVFRTVASQAERIGAGATFHGGGLVTDKPDSPHLLIRQFRVQLYVAIAGSDDIRQPDAKDKLKAAFAAFAASAVSAVAKSTVVVYTGTQHGWTVSDMPVEPNGKSPYDPAEAERAWSHLLQLYRTQLG